ncbi:MAG: DUF2723 domain-containing protein [Anaerolineae bacterium]|nr:DUF2723 domain-containing protein [Anaerolineae bacterium]
MKSVLSRDRRSRLYALGPVLAGLLALSLYASTAAPGLTWANEGADGGDLIAASMTWGVPHPSGYPTYCLLARLYALLPLGSVARRFNLFSATAAALSTSLVYLCARKSLGDANDLGRGSREMIALYTALFWTGGRTLWSQAVITEVYALASAFAALCLYLALAIHREAPSQPPKAEAWPGSPICEHGPRPSAYRVCSARSSSLWPLLGLAWGLGLGAHLTLAFLLPGLAVLVWRRLNPRRLLAFVWGSALGLSVFLYIPLAAAHDPLVNWGDARTWPGFWWLVSGRLYQRYLFGAGWSSWWSRSLATLSLIRAQFSSIGLFVGIVGLSQPREGQPPRLATALIVACFALYALSYDTSDSYLYLIPAYLAMTLWMADGLLLVGRLAIHCVSQRSRLARRACLMSFLLIPLVVISVRYAEMDISDDQPARRWTEDVVRLLPSRALLVTGEDRHTFALDYLLWVGRERQDILAIDGELLPYEWYRDQLSRRYPGLEVHETELVLFLERAGRDRPIFLSSLRSELVAWYHVYPYARFWRLEARNGA